MTYKLYYTMLDEYDATEGIKWNLWGTYSTRNKANEAAMDLRDSYGSDRCDVLIQEA